MFNFLSLHIIINNNFTLVTYRVLFFYYKYYMLVMGITFKWIIYTL